MRTIWYNEAIAIWQLVFYSATLCASTYGFRHPASIYDLQHGQEGWSWTWYTKRINCLDRRPYLSLKVLLAVLSSFALSSYAFPPSVLSSLEFSLAALSGLAAAASSTPSSSSHRSSPSFLA